MPDLIIQPTRKWIRLQSWAVFLFFCLCVGVYVNTAQERLSPWILVFPALLFAFPVRAWLKRRFTKVTLTGDKLRYEAGVLTKTTRTIQVAKVQDVRVDQSLVQRLSATGDLSIETAGETSQLVVRDIDDPQAVADAITEASQAQPPQQKPPKGAK